MKKIFNSFLLYIFLYFKRTLSLITSQYQTTFNVRNLQKLVTKLYSLVNNNVQPAHTTALT